jgi:hypothetical protein
MSYLIILCLWLAACGGGEPAARFQSEEAPSVGEPAEAISEAQGAIATIPPPTATQTQEPTTAVETPTPQLNEFATVAAPTPTVAPHDTPTPRPTPPPKTRRISPDVLLPSVSWGGGGGGGCGASDANNPRIILFVTEADERQHLETDQVPLGGWLTIDGCGFPPSEIANYTFRLPDGSVDSSQVNIDEYGDWYVEWWSLPGEPLGEYGFDLVSSAGVHTAHFTVYSPTTPVMTGACRGGQAALVLTGFAPGEEVLLGRYVYTPESGFMGNLVDYVYVLIGSDGTAIVNPPPEDAFFVAIGQNVQTFTTYDYDGDREIAYQASVTSELYCEP